MGTLGERLQSRREIMGLSQAKLADACEISQATIQKIEANKRPLPHSIQKIADVLGVTPGWLLYGTPLHRANSISNITNPQAAIGKVILLQWPDIIKLEKIGGTLIMDRLYEDNSLKRPFYETYAPFPQGTFAIDVQGDAMASLYPHPQNIYHGERLIVDPTAIPENGDYVIVTLNNKKEAVFRQFILDSGSPVLKAHNPQYKIIPFDDAAEIIGVVKEVVKILKRSNSTISA